MKKLFIPCIFLDHTKAVKHFSDHTVIHEDPVALAAYYSDNDADEILVFDFSTTDEEHEEALGLIKQICEKSQAPVIGAGNVKRMEDVKKLLYAGCAKACLNYSKQSNIDITQEVSQKFGKDKIVASFADPSVVAKEQTLLDTYVSELLCINPAALSSCIASVNMPFIAMLPEVSLDKVLEYLGIYSVCGITGTVVNDNVKEIGSLKHLCLENGIEVNSYENCMPWSTFKLNSDGMLPVVTQDYKTGEVLMVAYMTKEAYEMTLRTGKMTYYSRSRKQLWVKGDTSGHYQYVKELSADCDFDTLLAKVSQIGAACHTGNHSCFFNEILKKEYDDENPLTVFKSVFDIIQDRKLHPKEGSYTNYLFDKGIDKILKKVGEEATEIVIAAKNPNPDEIKYEISDFLYHVMVLMVEKGVTWEEITRELANR
ncbi:MAG: bifunctional phosphoribosyl-AMP cyclohydrolase/phosphoribosyl-ATP diphosphatase HisIE [Lachnospiraceae bacterium]